MSKTLVALAWTKDGPEGVEFALDVEEAVMRGAECALAYRSGGRWRLEDVAHNEASDFAESDVMTWMAAWAQRLRKNAALVASLEAAPGDNPESLASRCRYFAARTRKSREVWDAAGRAMHAALSQLLHASST